MKHAYLIMAHNNFKILEKTIMFLDSKYNDIYIHIDKKVKNFNMNYYSSLVKYSNLYFTKRLDVKWGSYSQIKCEYVLFKTAYKNHYDYYHLISGVDMPITSNSKIYNYFKENNGKEFVAIDNHNTISESSLERVKFYHFFVSWARSNNKVLKKIFDKFHFRFVKLQRKIGVNRLKKCPYKFRKGANWVSVTDKFVGYIISKESEIKKYFKFSYCADELFIQTLLYNSDFYKNICSLENDDYLSIKRCIDWKRGNPYTFKEEDFDFLIKSNCFFARKFSEKDSGNLIDKIYNYVKESKEDEN